MTTPVQSRSAVYRLLACLIASLSALATVAFGEPYHAVTGSVNYGGISYWFVNAAETAGGPVGTVSNVSIRGTWTATIECLAFEHLAEPAGRRVYLRAVDVETGLRTRIGITDWGADGVGDSFGYYPFGDYEAPGNPCGAPTADGHDVSAQFVVVP